MVSEVQTSGGPSAQTRRGRRRDPAIDTRIIDAAIELYAEVGWAGFTFEAVSRRADVGKPAIYLRWDSPEHLLRSALSSLAVLPLHDSGNLRDDLKEYALAFINLYVTPGGSAYLRWQIEQQYHSSLLGTFDVFMGPAVETARHIVERANERGELPPGLSGDVLLEAVHGAVFTRLMSLPVAQRRELPRKAAKFVDSVLDLVMLGITPR